MTEYSTAFDANAAGNAVGPGARAYTVNNFYEDKDKNCYAYPRLIPRNLVQRHALIDQVQSLLTLNHVCILIGPGGIGKTVLAAMIASTAESSSEVWWIDAALSAETCDLIPKPSDLVIVDNVREDQGLISAEWFRSLQCNVLVTSRSEAVARQILSNLGCADCSASMVYVEGLSVAESVKLLKSAVGDLLSEEQAEKLCSFMMGSPMALQAIPAILQKGTLPLRGQETRPSLMQRFRRWVSPPPAANPAELRLRTILIGSAEIDLEGLAYLTTECLLGIAGEQARQAVRALCRSSFFAMSPSVLATVTDCDPTQLRTALSELLNAGYVQRSICPTISEEVWIPHDLLREHFVRMPETATDRQADARYVKYIYDLSMKDQNGKLPINTAIDAWIVGARSTFFSKENLFHLRTLKDYKQFLEKILEPTSLSRYQGEYVARLLWPRVKNAECNELIPIAQVVSVMNPSPIVAKIGWMGASFSKRSHDAWVRSISIYACICHWRKLSFDVQSEGVQLILEWIDECTSRAPDQVFRQIDPMFEYEYDGDLAAAIGGLCELGAFDDALEIISSLEFHSEFQYLVLTIPTLIASQMKADLGDTQRLVDLLWSRVPPGATRQVFEEYFDNLGIAYPDAPDVRTLGLELSRDAAIGSFNAELLAWIKSNSEEGTSFLQP